MEGSTVAKDEEVVGAEAVALLQRLIRFDTVNPPDNEAEAQEHLRSLLEPAGFECELLSAVSGRPNRRRRRADGRLLPLAPPADPWGGDGG